MNLYEIENGHFDPGAFAKGRLDVVRQYVLVMSETLAEAFAAADNVLELNGANLLRVVATDVGGDPWCGTPRAHTVRLGMDALAAMPLRVTLVGLPMKRCPEPQCGRLFTVQNGRQKFCKPRCSDRARQARHRAKKKGSTP